MATRPFQFSAFVLQKPLAKGSFLVYPLHIGCEMNSFQGMELDLGFRQGGTHMIAAKKSTMEHQQEAQCSLTARA